MNLFSGNEQIATLVWIAVKVFGCEARVDDIHICLECYLISRISDDSVKCYICVISKLIYLATSRNATSNIIKVDQGTKDDP